MRDWSLRGIMVDASSPITEGALRQDGQACVVPDGDGCASDHQPLPLCNRQRAIPDIERSV
jgi:hypothetical protein